MLTLKEVADRFRVSKTTVCKWIKEGRLTAFRVGGTLRLDPDVVESFIRAQQTQTAVA